MLNGKNYLGVLILLLARIEFEKKIFIYIFSSRKFFMVEVLFLLLFDTLFIHSLPPPPKKNTLTSNLDTTENFKISKSRKIRSWLMTHLKL